MPGFAAKPAGIEIEYPQVIEHRGVVVSRERDFSDWSAALRAAGVDPAVLSRLEALPPGTAVEP